MKKNKVSVKYRFNCLGPINLTEYNVEWNSKVKDTCKQKELFHPHPSCQGCPYLEIRKLS